MVKSIHKPAPVQTVDATKTITKKKKKFKKMSEKFKQQGFAKRVGTDRTDKQAIVDYLNDEIKRHVRSMLDNSQR